MPLFPRFQYPQHATIFPRDVLRLLDDISNIDPTSDESSSKRGFTPNFDVHETEHEFILEGELPGLADKKDVALEFTDDKTLYIHGHIERTMERHTDDQGRIQTIEAGDEQKKLEAGDQGQQMEKEQENKEEGQHKDKGKQVEKKGWRQDRQKGPKYWVSERTVGEFSRSFSFPTTVDVEKVTATLENGILKVVVPKKEKPKGRKIEVK